MTMISTTTTSKKKFTQIIQVRCLLNTNYCSQKFFFFFNLIKKNSSRRNFTINLLPFFLFLSKLNRRFFSLSALQQNDTQQFIVTVVVVVVTVFLCLWYFFFYFCLVLSLPFAHLFNLLILFVFFSFFLSFSLFLSVSFTWWRIYTSQHTKLLVDVTTSVTIYTQIHIQPFSLTKIITNQNVMTVVGMNVEKNLNINWLWILQYIYDIQFDKMSKFLLIHAQNIKMCKWYWCGLCIGIFTYIESHNVSFTREYVNIFSLIFNATLYIICDALAVLFVFHELKYDVRFTILLSIVIKL